VRSQVGFKGNFELGEGSFGVGSLEGLDEEAGGFGDSD
jgi:hypothetical protein